MARDRRATADLKVRMKEPLRAKIEAAAAERGVSMNAEAVDRLERSFEREELLPEIMELAYGRAAAGILMALSGPLRSLASYAAFTSLRTTGTPVVWTDLPWAFAQGVVAVTDLLEELRPPGEIVDPVGPWGIGQELEGKSLSGLGKHLAETWIKILREPPEQGELADWAEMVRKKLGPEIIERLGKRQSAPATSAAAARHRGS